MRVSPRCCYLPLRPAVCVTDPPVFCKANSRWRSAETGEQVCLQCQSLPTLWPGFYGCCAKWQDFFGCVSLPLFSCHCSSRGQRCCSCCRFKRVGALFSSPSFIHSGMCIRRRRVEGWVKWLWETLRNPECVFPGAAPPSRPPPLISGGYLLEESWMCLDECGVSRSDLKPSQRCALRNSGGMFLVLASLSSPVSRVQRPL